MVCIKCGTKTSVINSRRQKRSNQVWRRRKCKACQDVFTSLEAPDLASLLIVDSRGRREPFTSDRLFADLLVALQHRSDRFTAAREASHTIIKQLLKLQGKSVLLKDEISLATAQVLSKLDRSAYLRYVAEHPWLEP